MLSIIFFICITLAVSWNETMAEGPVIQNLESIDVLGKKKGGGATLVIITIGLLDGSVETQQLLQQKLETYLSAINDPEFIKEFGAPDSARHTIVIRVEQPPAPEILEFLDILRPAIHERGASLVLKEYEEDP